MRSGYVYVLAPRDHPIKGKEHGKRRYIAEHRLIMERHLGRVLLDSEKVHHRNANKTDNRIENLEIVQQGSHSGWTTCPHCMRNFKIR